MTSTSERRGFFISFEGGEGSGKTSQINRLAGHLTEQGVPVLTTREPGGTPEAERIRAFLVQREGGNWSAMAECLLLFAARAMHVQKIIQPALTEGQVVISDRFTDSTRAYQGYGHEMPVSKIESLNELVLDGFGPDLTFLLDIDAEEGLRRSDRRLAAEALQVAQSEDRFEKLDLDFHERLRQGYLDLAKSYPERFVVLKADQDIDDLSEQIIQKTLERLPGGFIW